MKDKQLQQFYEFAEFRVDLKKRRLTSGEEIVPLTPKEFEVLLLLVERAGRVVEKDELMDAVWSDAFVEEGTLTRNISWLRKKLAAHGAEDLIETLPKRGYRFLAEVTVNGGNTLVLEEQTIQHIQVEETIEIVPSADDLKALPAPSAKRGFSPLWSIPVVLMIGVAVFAGYRGYFSRKHAEVVAASKVVPFSGLPGRENSPSFSPDGRQMVFTWDGGIEGGNADLYVKLIGSGEPVRLTNTPNDEINPVFSPDGKSVAFVRVFPDHNEIFLIPALGGAERKIYEKAGYASISFSPDGKSLAAADLDLAAGQAGIFLIDPASGEIKRITAPAAPAVDHTPRFSPDGKSLAFIRYFSSFKREIFVMPAGGGEARQVTSDDMRIYGLSWAADSANLFFTSFRELGRLNLWKVPVSGGVAEMIPTGSKDLQSLAIAPDGKTIAFVEETADENIWEIEPGSPPRVLIRSTRADHSQQFSPDGGKIVFASDRTGNYEIWLAEADGRNQQQLTDSSGSAGSPRFSPDGKFIVYDAQTAGTSDIYIMSSNGGAPKRLTQDGKNNSLPAWSADGRSVFFISNRAGSDQIWKIPADGGETVQITNQGAFEIYATADGKALIYSKGGGKSGLWRVGTDGAGEEPLPELAGVGGWRSWCVSAGRVYFTAFTAQPPFRIEYFDLASKQAKEITTVDKAPLTYYANFVVSPDGKRILYARQDQASSSIMLAELR